ncbi:hypothetical protein [Clostridium sp.]|nr:hypothetical protein [Clostridium sp.]
MFKSKYFNFYINDLSNFRILKCRFLKSIRRFEMKRKEELFKVSNNDIH